jgi:hypothetical protein
VPARCPGSDDAVVFTGSALRAGRGQQLDEHRSIELVIGDVDQVTGSAVQQPGRLAQGCPQPGDIRPQGVQRFGRRLVTPHGLDQAVRRDDRPGLKEQRGQQRTRLGAADVDQQTLRGDFQRPQDPELHDWTSFDERCNPIASLPGHRSPVSQSDRPEGAHMCAITQRREVSGTYHGFLPGKAAR